MMHASALPGWVIAALAIAAFLLALALLLGVFAILAAHRRRAAAAADDALLDAMSLDGIDRNTAMAVLARFRTAEGA